MGKKINILKILIHVLSWIGIFILLDLSHPLGISEVPLEYHLKILATILVLGLVFYFNTQILVPLFLFKKRVVVYVIVLIGIVIITYEINSQISSYLDFSRVLYQMDIAMYGADSFPYEFEEEWYEELEDIPTILILFSIAFGVITSFAVQHYKREKEQEKIEYDRKAAELAFLKNQVNPHFFFNTLNNIYALIAIEPKKARETVLQLSQMMRYVLYESDQDRVTLQQEFEFISEYIGLMRLRLNDENVISLDINERIDLKQKIPPLLFIPFVENAFKHGGGVGSEIYININQELNELVLKVVNKITNEDNEIGGLGLSNVKKRLQLLFPFNTYKLNVKEKDKWYMVELRIII